MPVSGYAVFGATTATPTIIGTAWGAAVGPTIEDGAIAGIIVGAVISGP